MDIHNMYVIPVTKYYTWLLMMELFQVIGVFNLNPNMI